VPLFLFVAAALAADAPMQAPPPNDADGSTVTSGVLTIDAKLPAEVLVDGVRLAQTYAAAELSFDIVPGDHLLRVYTHGQPHDVNVAIEPGKEVSVVVGRTGVSSEQVDAGPTASGSVPVEFRVLDGMASMIRIAGAKHTIPQGERLTLDLPVGTHPVSVRSADGTIIWASGRLTVDGGESVVVQVAEGRLPEVSGDGRFDPGGS